MGVVATERDNKVDCIEESAREKIISTFGIAEGDNESNYCINWFSVLRRFLARLIYTKYIRIFVHLVASCHRKGRVLLINVGRYIWYCNASCWKELMGNESPDQGYDIGDVTSENILILVQYLARNLDHVSICHVLFMQLVLVDELCLSYDTVLSHFSFFNVSFSVRITTFKYLDWQCKNCKR